MLHHAPRRWRVTRLTTLLLSLAALASAVALALGLPVLAAAQTAAPAKPVARHLPLGRLFRAPAAPATRQTVPPGNFPFVIAKSADGLIVIHYYNQPTSFGQKLVSDAEGYLQHPIKDTLGFAPKRAINIYIYNSDADFQAGASGTSSVEVGAFTDPATSTIYMPLANNEEEIDFLPHEMTHAVFHQNEDLGALEDQIRYFPLWLDEGLAAYDEQNPASQQVQQFNLDVRDAVSSHTFIDVFKVFNGDYPTDPQTDELGYAESRSFISYLIATYGATKFHTFLAQAQDDELVLDAEHNFGVDLLILQSRWEVSLGLPPTLSNAGYTPTVTTPVPFAAGTTPALAGRTTPIVLSQSQQALLRWAAIAAGFAVVALLIVVVEMVVLRARRRVPLPTVREQVPAPVLAAPYAPAPFATGSSAPPNYYPPPMPPATGSSAPPNYYPPPMPPATGSGAPPNYYPPPRPSGPYPPPDAPRPFLPPDDGDTQPRLPALPPSAPYPTPYAPPVGSPSAPYPFTVPPPAPYPYAGAQPSGPHPYGSVPPGAPTTGAYPYGNPPGAGPYPYGNPPGAGPYPYGNPPATGPYPYGNPPGTPPVASAAAVRRPARTMTFADLAVFVLAAPAALGAGILAAKFVPGQSWRVAALVAGGVVAPFAVAALLRVIGAGRRHYTAVGRLIGLVLLLGLAGLPLSQATALGQQQAQAYEASGAFQLAVNAYMAAGESHFALVTDVQRVRGEWAQAAGSARDYPTATQQLRLIIQQDDTTDAAAAAHTTLTQTTDTWGKALVAAHSFDQAINVYQGQLGSPTCDVACKTQLTSGIGAAYLLWGDSYDFAGDQTNAEAKYQLLIDQYPNSAAAATARSALGETKGAALFATALAAGDKGDYATMNTNLQQISSQYPNSSASLEANELPQPVTGKIHDASGAKVAGTRLFFSAFTSQSDAESFAVAPILTIGVTVAADGSFATRLQPGYWYAPYWEDASQAQDVNQPTTFDLGTFQVHVFTPANVGTLTGN